jgi:hypothetical protein
MKGGTLCVEPHFPSQSIFVGKLQVLRMIEKLVRMFIGVVRIIAEAVRMIFEVVRMVTEVVRKSEKSR